MEKFILGMSNIRITQGYGVREDGSIIADSTSSHNGANAVDLGGLNGSTNDYFTTYCTLRVCRVYGSYNATWFTNVNEVLAADGKIYKPESLVLLLIHANNATITELGIKVGKIFNPGDRIYREGSGGGVSAHIHLEVGAGPFTWGGWKKNGYVSSYGEVWEINNKLKPHELLMIRDEDTDLGKESYVEFPYSWKRVSEVEGVRKIPHPSRSEILNKGIDLSKFQTSVDWNSKILDKFSFVIARAVSSDSKGLYIDPKFEEYIQGAKSKNKKIGAYIYTYAFNEQEAEEEIKLFLSVANKYKFDYPIFIDFEDKLIQSQGKEVNTRLLNYFVKRLNEEGYPSVGVYTGTYWAENYIDISKFNGPVWIADYRGYCGYNGRVDIWQWGGETLDCITPSNVDSNNGYVDLTIGGAMSNYKIKPLDGRCEYFNSKDINDVAGKLTEGQLYNVITEYENYTIPETTIVGKWVTFTNTDGKLYWFLVLNGRTELIEEKEGSVVPSTPVEPEAPSEEIDRTVAEISETIKELTKVKIELVEMTKNYEEEKEKNIELKKQYDDLLVKYGEKSEEASKTFSGLKKVLRDLKELLGLN